MEFVPREARARRRSEARTEVLARDYMTTEADGWRIVSGTTGGRGGDINDRCGLVAHRGVLHPDEYVDEVAVLAAVEERLSFSLDEIREAYRQGPKSATQRELRAAIDARLAAVADAGGSVTALARFLGYTEHTLRHAVERGRADPLAGERVFAYRSVHRQQRPRGVRAPGAVTNEGVTSMAAPTVAALADGIGTIVAAKGYDRIVTGKRTLAYANPKKDALVLDFRAKDVAEAPVKLRDALTIKGTRALLRVNGKGGATARDLLKWLAAQA